MSRPPVALPLLVPLVLLVALAALAPAQAAPGERHRGHAPRPAATAPASAAPAPAAAPRLGRVLALVNRARSTARRCGEVTYRAVPRVTRDARLDRAAGSFARLMARRDFFSHDSPDGSGPGDRIGREGYPWSTYGEDIAAGQRTPAALVRAWLGSPGHCAVIMTRFRHVGIGYGFDAEATHQRYWVLDLASPRARG